MFGEEKMTTRIQSRWTRSLPLLLAIVGAPIMCIQAKAALLVPGAPAITTPGNASFAGLTQIADESFTVTGYDTSSNARYTATVETKVLKEPTGTLDFAYQVTNLLSGEPDSVEYVSVNSYRGFTTDADFVAGTGNVTYDDIARTAIAGGVTVTMDYTDTPNNIDPGDSTDWVLIKTNATSYDNLGSVNLLDGAPASVAAFEPAVPEPVSCSLFSIACIALLTARPARRQKIIQ
jgi:hypothetical protein